MKYQYSLISWLFLVCTFTSHADTLITPSLKENAMTITMNINDQQFEVRLYDNPAAKAFVKTLPLQLGMDELNGNEKFAELPHPMPSSPGKPGAIQSGDLMLYGTQTLVLFYASFDSSYRYTSIGKIINSENLSAMMDKKKIWVELEKN